MNLVDLAPLTISKPGAHTYGRKLRRAMIPMSSIEVLMQLDGTRSYRMEGWPEGSKIVGAILHEKPFVLEVFIYHPDFPTVPLDEYPSLIKVEATAVG